MSLIILTTRAMLSICSSSHSPAHEVLVRPSGVDSVDDIREGLGNAGISVGIDFIGEDQVVRDGVGEAKEQPDGAEQP